MATLDVPATAFPPDCSHFGSIVQLIAAAVTFLKEPAKLSCVRVLLTGKESVMRNHVLTSAAALAILALPLAACQSGVASGAAGGAVTGAIVGGPVGAAVGGVAGAAVGGALSADEAVRVRSYVVAQRRPSIRVADTVVVGQPLPPRVRLYSVPPSVGLRTPYSYTIVNDQTVLVDPQTRQIVQVID
jgi:hypothetical protein